MALDLSHCVSEVIQTAPLFPSSILLRPWSFRRICLRDASPFQKCKTIKIKNFPLSGWHESLCRLKLQLTKQNLSLLPTKLALLFSEDIVNAELSSFYDEIWMSKLAGPLHIVSSFQAYLLVWHDSQRALQLCWAVILRLSGSALGKTVLCPAGRKWEKAVGSAQGKLG